MSNSKDYIDLSSISFEQVIVHTLPKHKKQDKEVEPRYSERTSDLKFELKALFKEMVVKALGSDKALRFIYNPESLSPISTLSKSIIIGNGPRKKLEFVEYSKKIAKHLFDIQKGNNNEGILVVIPAKANQKNALILIKLEMDSGAQLVLNKATKSFDINAVGDLMLTKKTRVYKIALLLVRTLQNVKYDVIVTDNQIDMKAKIEVKSWFINDYLGCKPYKDPKIVTQNFYNYTKAYIDTIGDDLTRAKYHQDLNSYITKNSDFLNPQEFADDYLVTTGEKNRYKDYLIEKGFSFSRFSKDLSQIENKIKQMVIEFANGIVLTSKGGKIRDKVKFEKTEEGQTKATITSRLKKIK